MVISTCSRGTGWIDALVTGVRPGAGHQRASVTELRRKHDRSQSAVKLRNGFGTDLRRHRLSSLSGSADLDVQQHGQPAPSVIEASRWMATVHHSNPVSTVMPPITACTTVDAGISHA